MPFHLSNYAQIPVIYFSIPTAEACEVFLEILSREELEYLFLISKPEDKKLYPSWLHYTVRICDSERSTEKLHLMLDAMKSLRHESSALLDNIVNIPFNNSDRTILHEFFTEFMRDNELISKLLSMISSEACNKGSLNIDKSKMPVFYAAANYLSPDNFYEYLKKLSIDTLKTAVTQKCGYSTGFQIALSMQDSRNVNWIIANISPFKMIKTNEDKKTIDEAISFNSLISHDDKEKIKKIYHRIYKSVVDPKHEIEKRWQEWVEFVLYYIRRNSPTDIMDIHDWVLFLEKAYSVCKPSDHVKINQLQAFLGRIYYMVFCLPGVENNQSLIKSHLSFYGITDFNELDNNDNLFIGKILVSSFYQITSCNDMPINLMLALSFFDNIFACLEAGLKCLNAVVQPNVNPSLAIKNKSLFSVSEIDNKESAAANIKLLKDEKSPVFLSKIEDTKFIVKVDENYNNRIHKKAEELLYSLMCSSLNIKLNKVDSKKENGSLSKIDQTDSSLGKVDSIQLAVELAKVEVVDSSLRKDSPVKSNAIGSTIDIVELKKLFNAKMKEIDHYSRSLYNPLWKKLASQLFGLYKIVKSESKEEIILLKLAKNKIQYELSTNDNDKTGFLLAMQNVLKQESSGIKKSFFVNAYQKWLEETKKTVDQLIEEKNRLIAESHLVRP